MTAVRTIGIMTGNSLDGVDIVLTGFENGRITDLGGFSKPYPRSLTEKMLRLRARIREEGGRMERLVEDGFSLAAIDEYTSLVAETVNTFLPRSGCRREDIAALGFHGQTCDHFPPSIAGGEPAYTVQVGNAGLLADLTGIPVICDFRSDDIMAGGEGAPLAPVHNLHIAGDLRNKGVFPVAFCNAGNTGNISVITEDKDGKTSSEAGTSGLLIIIPIIWFVRIRGSLMMTADGWRPAGGLFRNCCAICLTTLRLTVSAGIFIFKRRRNLPIRAGTVLPKV